MSFRSDKLAACRDEIEQTYNKAEEIANAITHGLGIAFGITVLVLLVVFSSLRGEVWKIVSFSIYGATLIILYTASTLYHSFRSPKVKCIFRIIDHVSIYLLIAGTYTPFTLVNLRGPWGWSLFGTIWGLAIVGIIFKIVFFGKYEILSTIIYLGMGWIAIVAIKPMIAIFPTMGLWWIVIGGLFYSLGVIFFVWEKLPFNHAIWHLFVLGGSVSHFIAMILYVLPAK